MPSLFSNAGADPGALSLRRGQGDIQQQAAVSAANESLHRAAGLFQCRGVAAAVTQGGQIRRRILMLRQQAVKRLAQPWARCFRSDKRGAGGFLLRCEPGAVGRLQLGDQGGEIGRAGHAAFVFRRAKNLPTGRGRRYLNIDHFT